MHPIEPEELMAYLDGELMTQRASEAAQHLSHCRECQSAAAEMRSVSRRLLEWQIEEPGPRVEQTLNSARPLERSRPIWRLGVPWVAGLAAACLLLLIVSPKRRWPMGSTASSVQEEQGAKNARVRAMLQQLPQGAPQNQNVTSDIVSPWVPLIIRTAQITLTTTNFPQARASLEEILKRHGGHIGNLNIGSPADSGQTLQATLRFPVNRLDAAVAEVRHLGRVEIEQQRGEEVTGRMVDLEARLANAHNTERRLADILRGSTGKITDVLAVEKEIDRVRGEIESMDAEHKNLGDRVNFATLDLRIREEYQSHLAVSAPSTPGRLRNSAVEGYRNVADSLAGIAMFVLSCGPVLVLWAGLLFFPARYAWRRLRKSLPQ